MKTNIEWADENWNLVMGCTKISEGCQNCYAEANASRYAGRRGYEHKPWTSANAEHNVRLNADLLRQPYRWRNPRRIMVNNSGDLFHEQVPYEFIRDAFDKMWGAHWHIYLVLTKRPERMLEVIPRIMKDLGMRIDRLKNIWLGVSVENQQMADERIPLLLKTPAAVRWLSVEPMLESVDLAPWIDPIGCCESCDTSCTGCPAAKAVFHDDDFDSETGMHPPRKINWVVVGGETGKNARPLHLDWVRDIRDLCHETRVPFFSKQSGDWTWDKHDPLFGYGAYYV